MTFANFYFLVAAASIAMLFTAKALCDAQRDLGGAMMLGKRRRTGMH